MNNLKELWAIFDWVTSGQVLGELKEFTQNYARIIVEARDIDASEGKIRAGERANKQLQELLKPYFLQRLKVDFLADKLPSKTELVLWTHLSTQQRSMYIEFTNAKEGIVRSILTGEKPSPLEAITFLKKLCGHPLLVEQPGDDLAIALKHMDVDDIVAQSTKLQILCDLVDRLRRNGHRILIFSQQTRMLDIIQKVLSPIVRLARIDGKTRERDRQIFVDEFNAKDSAFDAMLLSTKAAGIGLTLTGADRVIVYDPSWTPAEDSQAVDRCYRTSH
jgi:SNF2 family DNA or RNA helicase